MDKADVVVCAAVIERDARYLVTRRLEGTHLAGLWEFPGGKCDPGETHRACLAREIEEELGCGVVVGGELLAVRHEYPERTVELHFFRCTLDSDPQPRLGQDMRWVAKDALRSLQLPPADAELIRVLES